MCLRYKRHMRGLKPHPGPCTVQAPKAVMGPGTGLGEANLFWDEEFGSYRVWPSEGSHATFAPRGWKQRALQAFVEQELGYCEIEHVRDSLPHV